MEKWHWNYKETTTGLTVYTVYTSWSCIMSGSWPNHQDIVRHQTVLAAPSAYPRQPFLFFFCSSIDDPKHFLTNILRKYRNGKPLFLYFEDQALEFWVKTKECSSKPAFLRCMIILWLSQTEGNCISWVFVNCIFRTAHHGMVQTDCNNQLQQITGTTKYK